MNKNRGNRHSRPHQSTGFTLIETLVSFLLVFMGVLFIAQMIFFSLDYYKKSLLRLNLQQKLQFETQLLTSKPFDATELNTGIYVKEDDPFKISWEVFDLTPTIKKIVLSVGHKQFSQRVCFFKSKYIFTI